jgi:hypothetical protein
LDPGYLDAQGLLALWREALLAQKVLRGKTVGYRNHPQLERFKRHPHPKEAIATYLLTVWKEAHLRGYCFDKEKIGIKQAKQKIPVTSGQLHYEFKWLCAKLKRRSLRKYREIILSKKIWQNPFFRVVPGSVEKWERITPRTTSATE